VIGERLGQGEHQTADRVCEVTDGSGCGGPILVPQGLPLVGKAGREQFEQKEDVGWGGGKCASVGVLHTTPTTVPLSCSELLPTPNV